jgi:hypothetical protein
MGNCGWKDEERFWMVKSQAKLKVHKSLHAGKLWQLIGDHGFSPSIDSYGRDKFICFFAA